QSHSRKRPRPYTHNARCFICHAGADAKIHLTWDLVAARTVDQAMANLPRLKPDPIPQPHPLPEFLAEDELKARYEDMKAVLGVPWMGVVTMSFAHFRAFYDALWQGVRPLCASREFTDACHRLRHLVEEKVSVLGPPPLRQRLAQTGYAARELQDIDESIEIF